MYLNDIFIVIISYSIEMSVHRKINLIAHKWSVYGNALCCMAC